MSRYRGTKPTRSQRNILNINGYNPDDYLYLKSKTEQYRGGSLSRDTIKTHYLIFINKNDNYIIECKI